LFNGFGDQCDKIFPGTGGQGAILHRFLVGCGERKMVQITFEMPEDTFGALRKAPQDFAREMRLAAAVKWYELRLLSQERAAQVAGVCRAEFLEVLGRFGVSPFQYGPDEILEEANRE
jgi:predicted HTH domain antitoxin